MGSILPPWISALTWPARPPPRPLGGQFRVGTGLDHRPRLGQVLGGVDDRGFQPVTGVVEVRRHLGDGAEQHVGLVQALLRGPDRDGGEAALAGAELFLGRGGGVLDKGQPFLGLADVVRHLRQCAVSRISPGDRSGTPRRRRFWPGLPWRRRRRQPAPAGRSSQAPAEESKSAFLLLEGRQRSLGPADDLAEPGPLLLLGVRDVVIELLLQFERFGHVGLGVLQCLGKVPDGGIAVLRLGEAKLLLAGLDGVVRSISSEPLLRRSSSTLSRPAGPGRHPAGRRRCRHHGCLLAPVAEVKVGSHTAAATTPTPTNTPFRRWPPRGPIRCRRRRRRRLRRRCRSRPGQSHACPRPGWRRSHSG